MVLGLLQSSSYDQKTHQEVKCGIPLVNWLNIFFIAFGARSLGNLARIYVIKNMRRKVMHYEIFRLLVIDGFLLAWIFYGNKLYYSKENDCEKIKSTKDLGQLMGVLLFIGYLMIGMYLVIMCTFPCLYFYIR